MAATPRRKVCWSSCVPDTDLESCSPAEDSGGDPSPGADEVGVDCCSPRADDDEVFLPEEEWSLC